MPGHPLFSLYSSKGAEPPACLLLLLSRTVQIKQAQWQFFVLAPAQGSSVQMCFATSLLAASDMAQAQGAQTCKPICVFPVCGR
jgi:hypothetical protein